MTAVRVIGPGVDAWADTMSEAEELLRDARKIEARRRGWREGYRACIKQLLEGVTLDGDLRQHVADVLIDRVDLAAAESEAYREEVES